jgi:hypothetical protein
MKTVLRKNKENKKRRKTNEQDTSSFFPGLVARIHFFPLFLQNWKQ